MNFDLNIYGRRSLRVELPAVTLQTWSLQISGDVSGFSHNITVPMVVMHDQWCFASSGAYQLWRGSHPHFERQMAEGDVYRLEVPGEGVVAIQVVPQLDVIPVWDRYLLRKKHPTVSIGSARACDICVQGSKALFERHATLTYVKNGVTGTWVLQKNAPAGLCYVNGELMVGERTLRYGDVIDVVGLCLIYLGELIAVQPPLFTRATMHVGLQCADAQTLRWIADVGMGGTSKVPYDLFSPAPRIAPDFDVEPIDIEGPPNQQSFNDQSLLSLIGPQLTAVLPMAAAAALSTAASPVGLPMMMASAAGSAFWTRKNQKERKREAQAYERLRATKYLDYLAAKREAVAQAYEYNRTTLIERYPAAQDVVDFDTTSEGLWNRNRYQQDYGFVRLGRASCPSPKPVNVPAQRFTIVEDDLVDGPSLIKEEFEFLDDVPVGIDLLQQSLFGVVGEVGSRGYATVVRALLAQLATSYRYDDLKIAFICDGSREEDRVLAHAVRWLPHTWSENRTVRYVASDLNGARVVLRELSAVAAERSVRKKDQAVPAPHYVVFVLPGTPLASTSAAAYLLDSETSLGFTTFVCAEHFGQLPNACVQIIENSALFQGAHSVRDPRSMWLDIAFDHILTGDIARLARRLCAVRLETPEQEQGIPSSLSFTELYGIETVEDLNLGERWRAHAANESLAVPLGKSGAGIDYIFDIHEKFHGPHGLVAGTTGSGKSEALMALVLSLVVNFGPDEVAFLLVDFKGGGLANHFTHDGTFLPHVVGTITNLSGNTIQRALAAVRSENERRQRMLADAHANDVYEYGRLYHNRMVSEPMPHLMIVVDEFAELKSQFPTFIDELVSVVTIGRALGVHLVLATQKPAGVVSGTIEANVNFRMCLRVQSKEDSKSMLDVHDAARDKLAMPPGRALIKVGAAGHLEEFQSAFTRASYMPSAEQSLADAVRMRTLTGAISQWERCSHAGDGDNTTQLQATVAHIIDYARRNDIRPARKLWMPELPSRLLLSELPPLMESDEWRLVARVGRYDQPQNQRQGTALLKLSAEGGCLLLGTNGSGKSTLLQTALFDLVNTYTPDELWVYALDFSNHMLDCLETFPQVGGVLHETDDETIVKLFHLLDELVTTRKEVLHGGTYLQYRKRKCMGSSLPAVVLTIDNYALFAERTADAFLPQLLSLAKQGPSCGIYLLISAAGIMTSEIPRVLANNVRGRIALQLVNRAAYAELLIGADVDIVPDTGMPGRGLLHTGEKAFEFQAALALNAPDDFGRSERVTQVAQRAAQAWTGPHARHIPRIPQDPTLTSYLELDEVQSLIASRDSLPLGYSFVSARPWALDLSTIFCYVVSGRQTAGRENFMALVAHMAAKKAGPSNVHFLGRGKGTCVKAAAETGIVYYQPNDDLTKLQTIAAEILRRNARKHSYDLQGLSGAEIYQAMSDENPIFILIEDLTQTIAHLQTDLSLKELRAFLNEITKMGRYHRVYVFAGFAQAETGLIRGDVLYQNIVSDKAGMHFGGKVNEQQLLDFDYLTTAGKKRSEPPSVGLPATGELARGEGSVVIPDATR